MRVTLENEDKSVSLNAVRYVKVDRGVAGEMLISNRKGVLSVYQNGKVLYTEEEDLDNNGA